MAKSRGPSPPPSYTAGQSNQDVIANEQTPLLAEAEGVEPPVRTEGQPDESTVGTGAAADADDKPLPVVQLLVLSYARLVEPIAFFSIFPYVNQMCQRNGDLADADVGFYSGLIESLFSLTQAALMIFWGRLADRYGRKPVLVVSLFGVSIAISMFGLATTIPEMIAYRCLAGIFAGSIVTIRTMLAEISTPKTQARAFTYFAVSGNLGIFLGPLLGGALADPAGQYHGPFEKVPLFVQYPYFLASFVVGLFGLSAAFLAAFFCEETLVKKPTPEPAAANGTTGSLAVTNSASTDAATAAARVVAATVGDDKDENSIRGLLKAPSVGYVLYVYLHVGVLAFAYTAVIPVFWFTPIPLGGYGLTPVQISLLMGLSGGAQTAWLLLVFPPLHRRVGTNGVMRMCANVYPLLFLLCPVGNIILRIGTQDAETAFWVLMPPLICIGVGVAMCFTAIQLAINDVSPSPHVLATLNAVALTMLSVTRAFCPALFTSLFAVGAHTQWLRGYAIWVLLAVLAAGFTVAARYMPDYEELRAERQEAERERERAAAGWIDHDVTDR